MALIKKIISLFKKPEVKEPQPVPTTKVAPENTTHKATQEKPDRSNPKRVSKNSQDKSKPNSRPDRSRSKAPSSGKKTSSRNSKNKSYNKDDRPRRNHNSAQRKPYKAPQTPVKPKGKEFKDLGIHPKLVEMLAKNKFTHATEVQERSVAPTIAGKNIFCSSETGSGKTLSFLIPMIHKFYNNEINQALIICPTREIAIQIQKRIDGFTDASLTSELVIGGTDMREQKEALKKYPKILVATPGRLLDMLKSGLIWLEYTGYVVLDEADRMLDMGFEEDLNQIRDELTGKHQIVLFSATLFPEIKKMAKRFAQDFEEIVIGDPTSVAGSVEHVLVEMSESEKKIALKFLLRRNRGKSMVFFNTIRETNNITQQMIRQRVARVDCIHSKVTQPIREAIITDFRSGKINALLASDVASRGIDIPNVELVINYDVPNNSEEYIHRVGRTGRAGQTGTAITFYSSKDQKKLVAIEKLIDAKIKRVKDYRTIL